MRMQCVGLLPTFLRSWIIASFQAQQSLFSVCARIALPSGYAACAVSASSRNTHAVRMAVLRRPSGCVLVCKRGYFRLAAACRNARSTISFGSVDTGPSRHSQRIISGIIAPPNFWPCRFMPHV
jgi:hypothetical protein